MPEQAHNISLEQARELVSLLEAGDHEKANEKLDEVFDRRNDKLFTSVGQLTRDLHDALQDFQLDPRIVQLTEDELPDAQNRLQYVIEKTEDAANRTMDAVEACLPMADDMHAKIDEVMPQWRKLMDNDIELAEFKQLCHGVDNVLNVCAHNMPQIHGLMTEVLMAQDYQDITGQVIRRVITLVQDVEKNLLEMLKLFGDELKEEAKKQAPAEDKGKAEGPVIDADKRDDVVSGQDDVDDLLSSLGF
ncbi:protein phosphatase CheZ [Idiomarina seosinensis]|uniref:protein phosphatase CheZ n=1 Tax=Idiomarina seosinensis TaxID=281739 RepID=UPI0038515E27